MQAFLKDLKQVAKSEFDFSSTNCYVLNQQDQLTHLAINQHSHIVFAEIVANKTLIWLNLNSNSLTSLPEDIAQLGNLEALDLSSNKLTTLPAALLKLPNLSQLKLTNNPITKHLKGIEDHLEPQALISYLLEVQDQNTKPLNEAKVLVVGNERVGKTSLIKRLLGQRHNPNQPSTAGIDIQNHRLSNGIQVNIWDFAGQEITHQTHQFFLTSKSLYLYVLDSQKEDNDSTIYHWLSQIKANSGDSPIVIVVNKCDLNVGYTFDLHRYKDDFNIVAVLELSAENNDAIAPEVKAKITHTIDDLTRCVEQQVAALDDIQFPLPPTWAKVKAELEAMSTREENFIENEDYETLCQNNGIDNERLQDTLLTILNQIGTIVTYKNNDRLKVMQIINPLWVTNGVYKIIRSPLITNNALLNQAQFEQIFHGEAKYKTRHYNWLKDLLNQFELSFNIDDTTILIPSKLNPNQPQFNLADFQRGLNFRYRYHSLLKKSVISQFIVKMKDYIVTTGDKYWQRGVFLHYGDCQGVVIADEEKKTIVIAINTNGRAAQELLSIIRHTLRTVNGEHLRCDEQVPLMIDKQIVGYEDYDYLVECEKEGDTTIRLGITGQDKKTHSFTITELLDGYRLKDATRFDYDKLTADLIAISQLETENRFAINSENENQTNDRFKTALLNRGYNVADQARGGTIGGKSDLIIRNNITGVAESIIEAFILNTFNVTMINQHIRKLTNNYDTIGNRRNFLLVYVKSAGFYGLWEKYRDHFDGFTDVSSEYAAIKNVKVGITKIDKMEVFHIFIAFASPGINGRVEVNPPLATTTIARFKEDTSQYNFNVRNFQGIQQIQTTLPLDAPWIFLTGYNGYGKTNILQALARVLSNPNDQRVYDGIKPLSKDTFISMSIDDVVRTIPQKRPSKKYTYRILAYGASRLDMGSDRSTKEYKPCSSLFETQVLLRNIEREGLSRWYFNDEIDKFDHCVETFKKLMPNLVDVIVRNGSEVWYVEQGEDGDLLPEVQFKDLATGYQNIISMVGDIILNLAAPEQQYEDIRLKTHMKAIVLIDEVELYLHPQWQKRLPQLLTDLFPNIIFIASTHSPIPLLGAPKNSAIFVVNRTKEHGITMTRFDDKIDIDELLPNAILTSPIFGMEDIYAANFSGNKPVRTEDGFNDMQLNKAIEQKITDFACNKADAEKIARYMQKAKSRSKR